MTMTLPLTLIHVVDILGSSWVLVLSLLCLRQSLLLKKVQQDNALVTYILWLTGALFSFGLFRSLGHLVKYILLYGGHDDLWTRLSPVSGSLITVTFIVIFATTLFFRDMLTIMNRMQADRRKIEQTSAQLFQLNQDIESMVSDRTRAELSFQFAHEIRNPITIIGGLLQRLSCEGDHKKETHSYVQPSWSKRKNWKRWSTGSNSSSPVSRTTFRCSNSTP